MVHQTAALAGTEYQRLAFATSPSKPLMQISFVVP